MGLEKQIEKADSVHKDTIFELLKTVRRGREKRGLLIAYNDFEGVFKMGSFPRGTRRDRKAGEIIKEFMQGSVCSIYSSGAKKEIKRIGKDGAVLIDNLGFIYEPSVYLNVDAERIDKSKIKPDYFARHIAALGTSILTNATTFALSEDTGIIREFYNGIVKRQYPRPRKNAVKHKT